MQSVNTKVRGVIWRAVFNSIQLRRVASHFDSLTSAHPGLATYSGWWARIAAATEEMAGIATPANDNITGYQLRTVLALEYLAGTDGAEENDNIGGYLKRMVDALKVLLTDSRVETGDVGRRFVSLALQLVYAVPPSPDGWILDFSNADMSGLLLLIFEDF